MKLPSYTKYKESGVEWLGRVPEHWALLRFVRGRSSLPQRGRIIQPRAAPWVTGPIRSTALKGRDNPATPALVAPTATITPHRRMDYAALSGRMIFGAHFPGRCPGLDYGRPFGAAVSLPRRGRIIQPRATPWESITKNPPSPERAC